MEVKKKDLQTLYDILTNYPVISREQIKHEMHKVFGESIFASDTEAGNDAESTKAEVDVKQILEKQIQPWYEDNTDKRCALVIAAEEQGSNISAHVMCMMGRIGNIKLAVVQAMKKDEDLPKILESAMKHAFIENLIKTIKEEEKK